MSALQYRALRDDPRVGLWTALLVTAVLALWRFSSFSDAGGGNSSVKYVLYWLPFLCVLLQVGMRGLVLPINPSGLQAFGCYLLALVVSLAVSKASNPFLTRDVVIVSTYILMFAVAWSATSREVTIMAFACFLCMGIEALQEGISFSVSVLDSDGILESVMAFPLGVILLYAIRMRRYVLGLVVALLFFAAYKRIAIMAVVGVLLFEWAVAALRLSEKRRALAILLVVGLSAVSLFSAPIFEYLATAVGGENVSANSISLGRFDFSQAIWRHLGDGPKLLLLFGHGPGTADNVLQIMLEAPSNPHNDWLKIFSDYGIFGFILFHIILYKMYSGNAFAISVYLYTAIVMMTDNVLIYTFYHVIALVVIRAAPSLAIPPLPGFARPSPGADRAAWPG